MRDYADADYKGGGVRWMRLMGRRVLASGRHRPFASALLASLGFAAPAALYLGFIHHYGLNIISADEWEDVGVVHAAHTGQLTFHTLWAPYSVERLFFPRLVTLVLAATTHLNTVTEMYLSAVLLSMSVALLVMAHRRGGTQRPLYWYCPVAIVLLSLVQYEDTLWGFQLAWYMVLFGFACVEYFLDRAHLTIACLVGAVTLAIVASFSSFQGLLIWPTGLIILGLRRARRSFVLIWIVCSSLAAVLYFRGLRSPGGELYGLIHPAVGIQFFLFAVGDVVGTRLPPVATSGSPAVEAFGALMVVSAAWVIVSAVASWRDRRPPRQYVGVAMVIFGLLWNVSAALSQSIHGIAGASLSRFTLYSLLIPAGCYLATIDEGQGKVLTPQRMRVAAIGFIVVLVGFGTANGLAGGRYTEVWRRREAVVTVNAAEATRAQRLAVDPIAGEFLAIFAAEASQLKLSMYHSSAVAYYKRLGLMSGVWADASMPPVRPWQALRTGETVSVRSGGFPPSASFRLVECSPAEVSSLWPGLAFLTSPSGQTFSFENLGTDCVNGVRVTTDARGMLHASYTVAERPWGHVSYLAVENLTATNLVALAELRFR